MAAVNQFAAALQSVAALDADVYQHLSRNALDRAHARVWDKVVEAFMDAWERPRGQAPVGPLRLETRGDVGRGNGFGNGSKSRLAYDV